ncbi:MAG: tRNA (cytidine(34)-2'-O)-methyltransferase, partial [Lachnospiraceae bacterium]|nr:tRNA (cytidine(34)-2'-O)-methyltransferase [Lachnospiraceae bacterium]
GNIGRTCDATGVRLHLIEPLGFKLDEKSLKRAGMDYWQDLDVRTYVNFEDFLRKNPDAYRPKGYKNIYDINTFDDEISEIKGENKFPIYMATTKSHFTYTDVEYPDGSYIMFGNESRGIPEEILLEYEDTCIRIPMLSTKRSLNLSNSVAIILYEALRQNDFKGLEKQGELHRLHWKE